MSEWNNWKTELLMLRKLKKLMKDENFSVSMNLDELDAWFAFVEIVENSFGNHEAENTRNSFITC